jgi:hypothetical protein
MKFYSVRRGLVCAAILVLASLAGAQLLHGQSTTEGAIAGTVLDPSGATVSGAAVTLHNEGTTPRSS